MTTRLTSIASTLRDRTSLPAGRSAKLALCVAAGMLIGSAAQAGPVIAGWDFENATAGSGTAAASATGAGITGATFGGTNGGSSVVTFSDNLYTSSALTNGPGGSLFNYFSFTTSGSLDLGTLSFEGGQNDNFPNAARSFEIRLSPAGAGTPAGQFGAATTGWELLDTVSLPYGFADSGTQNISLDLTGTTIGPGTYQVAIGAQSGINVFTAQLFMDDVVLTAADVVEVPAPGAALLFGLGLAALAANRRRR